MTRPERRWRLHKADRPNRSLLAAADGHLNSGTVKTKRVQIISMGTSALFLPLVIFEGRLIWSSKLVSASFFVALYACVLAALLSTFLRYRAEQRMLLPHWRRMPYITGVLVLLVLSLAPLATWPIGLSGVTLHLRSTVLGLLAVNAAAAILVWFGSGWSRLGLTVVAYWVMFLWMIPLGMRG